MGIPELDSQYISEGPAATDRIVEVSLTQICQALAERLRGQLRAEHV